MIKSKNATPDFKTLFESAPGLYLVLSPQLVIVAVSNAYLKATMTNREAIIGKGLFDIFPDNPNDPAASGVSNLKDSLHRVLAQKIPDTMAVQKYDIQRPESEGGGFEERHWSPLNTPILNESNELIYIIHRVEDVTEFVKLKEKGNEQTKITEELKTKAEQMEVEVFRRAQEIQRTNQKLRDAEKVKSEFFANVSHELRTPLSLILAPVESIMSGKYGVVSKEQNKYLQTIHNNCIRLLQMVNALLDFAKFEAGKTTVHREPTDMRKLIASILNDFGSVLGGKKISLHHEVTMGAPFVLMDRYLLERIMFNLLSNAAKFTPEAGHVTVLASHQDEEFTLSVSDTGIGIPESAIQDLFKKFSQVEGSSTRRFEGTGLGLAMVKEFTELLGGSVSVISTVGKGSVFTIRCHAPATTNLPDEDRTVPTVKNLFPSYKSSHVQIHEGNSSSLKVLVCEDNQELLEYTVSLLQHFCQLKTAKNGALALELVNSWKPDLVLTDVMMPEKDGIEVCKAIKTNPETAKTLVVLLTAMTHREAMLRGWDAKADDYLFKPFHPEELMARIKSMLASVSARKKADQVIEEKNVELIKINKDLEAFSYSVSHDLRAPLRSIVGYAQVLEEDFITQTDGEAKSALTSIQRNASKMNKLIDDLLHFSKVDKTALLKSYLDTEMLVLNLINEIRPTTGNTEFKFDSLLPSYGDSFLLTQVWLNLLSNAAKYSSKKNQPIVQIGSYLADHFTVFFVKDNGAGFNMDYADKLFGVFQRLHRTNEFEGTGIGLALVKRIVDRHGGKVWAEAKENEGATFHFSLPNG